MTNKKVCVVLSGGLDSTVLMYQHLNQGWNVRAVSVNYGQRHSRELTYAQWQCQRKGVPHTIVDLSGLGAALPGSSLTDSTVAVPEGHYAAETMKATVVPNRNMILLAVALGHAIAHGCEWVSYAAHAGDHAIYPDCRVEFVEALRKAAALCDWHPAQIATPFIGWAKKDIVHRGHVLRVPFEETWSCYVGGKEHCGRCGTCVERREAFHLAGVPDPTGYDAAAPSVETMIAKGWKL